MEESKKQPFLPPNFVTLAQLQERWLKDQEEKQKQKEREEEEEREKKQQQQQQQEEEERRRGNGVNRRRGGENRDARRRQSRSNQSEKNRRTGEVGEWKLVDVGIGGGSINDEGHNVADSKKKSRRNRKNKKTRVEENLSEGTAQLTQTNSDKDGIRRELKRNGKSIALNNSEENESKVEFRRNGKYLEKKISVDRMKLKFDDLTLNNGGKLGEDESVKQNTRGRRFGYRRDSRKLNPWNPRNPNLVWVKKGEVSDADATGI